MADSKLDAPAQALVDALQHLRGSDASLRQCITYLRQDGRDVPPTIEDALGCIRDALEILEEWSGLDAARAEALACAALGRSGPFELLRAAEGATFRAAGLGIVKVQLLARRPLAEARREAVAVRALAACGAPLAAPLDDPVAIEDVVVGTWRDVPDEGRADPGTAAALGDALRVLHAVGGPALATGAVAVAAWAPLGWLDGRLARVRDHVDAALAEQLRAGAEAAFAVLAAAPVAVLHTDAHRGNARITRRGGAILVDTEGLAAGPAIYDLAAPVVLERRYGGDERRVLALLAAYGAAPDDPLLAAACRLREHLAVAWLAGRAEDEPALLDEARRRADDLAAGRDDATWTAR